MKTCQQENCGRAHGPREREAMNRQCFVCAAKIEPCRAMGDGPECPPDNGTSWHSRGNWGSAVLDLGPEDYFCELFVCDSCLKSRMGLVVCVRAIRHMPEHEYIGTLATRERSDD